jgi:hypothetical protein
MNSAHEQQDADVISLFLIAIITFVTVALIFLSIWAFMRFLALKETAREKPPGRVAETTSAFPAPRLQVQPAADLERLRAREQAWLNSYGWVDRSNDIAHIPIDRAMQLILERGLPDVGRNQTPLQLMQVRPQEIRSPNPQQ